MITTNNDQILCPGCGGSRVHRRSDGVMITCPVCGGSGWIFSESGVHITC